MTVSIKGKKKVQKRRKCAQETAAINGFTKAEFTGRLQDTLGSEKRANRGATKGLDWRERVGDSE